MIRVLVVDDSAVVRSVLSTELSKAADIEVVGTAVDALAAHRKVDALAPDVITLDIEMPGVSGLAFLTQLMQSRPMPVIVVSSFTPEGSREALWALELGAVDVVAKPSGGSSTVGEVAEAIIQRVRAAAAASRTALRRPWRSQTPERPPAGALDRSASRLLAIGASTGGTEAIRHILTNLPADTPGTVIVQHMPAGFTRAFADRLDQCCDMTVREARGGETLCRGLALVAPGDRHMTVRTAGGQRVVDVKDGPKIRHQRPSVDVLMHSVARVGGADALGVLLTGMGSDGAEGLLAMRQAGAATIAQDEASCAVFGMPREAIRVGAAEKVLSLQHIPTGILKLLAREPSRAAR